MAHCPSCLVRNIAVRSLHTGRAATKAQRLQTPSDMMASSRNTPRGDSTASNGKSSASPRTMPEPRAWQPHHGVEFASRPRLETTISSIQQSPPGRKKKSFDWIDAYEPAATGPISIESPLVAQQRLAGLKAKHKEEMSGLDKRVTNLKEILGETQRKLHETERELNGLRAEFDSELERRWSANFAKTKKSLDERQTRLQKSELKVEAASVKAEREAEKVVAQSDQFDQRLEAQRQREESWENRERDATAVYRGQVEEGIYEAANNRVEARVELAKRGHEDRKPRRADYNAFKDSTHTNVRDKDKALRDAAEELKSELSAISARSLEPGSTPTLDSSALTQVDEYIQFLTKTIEKQLLIHKQFDTQLHFCRQRIRYGHFMPEAQPSFMRYTAARIANMPMREYLDILDKMFLDKKYKRQRKAITSRRRLNGMHYLHSALSYLTEGNLYNDALAEPAECQMLTSGTRDKRTLNVNTKTFASNTSLDGRMHDKLRENSRALGRKKAKRIVLLKVMGLWTPDEELALRNEIIIARDSQYNISKSRIINMFTVGEKRTSTAGLPASIQVSKRRRRAGRTRSGRTANNNLKSRIPSTTGARSASTSSTPRHRKTARPVTTQTSSRSTDTIPATISTGSRAYSTFVRRYSTLLSRDLQDDVGSSLDHENSWETCSEDDGADVSAKDKDASDVKLEAHNNSRQSFTSYSRDDVDAACDADTACDADATCDADAAAAAAADADVLKLEYHIPADVLTKARDTPATHWSFRLYKNPTGEPVRMRYYTTYEKAEAGAMTLLNEPVLGFDLEWEEYSKPGKHDAKRCVSMLQLATQSACHLFHIALFKGSATEDLMPPSLRAVLASPDCIKAGVNVAGDSNRMRTCFGVEMQGVFELSHMYKLVNYGENEPSKVDKRLVKLADQVQELLLLPLDKGEVRTSRWSSKLSIEQSEYAASDAYAGFRLFHALDEKRRLLEPTPPRPAFWELFLPIELADGTLVKSKPRARKEVTAAIEDEENDEFFDALETQDEIDDCVEIGDDAKPMDVTADASKTTHPKPERTKAGLAETEEIHLANGWVESWLTSRPAGASSTLTAAKLRAYHLWHIQGNDLSTTAALLRDPPLALNTVATYVIETVTRAHLAYDNDKLKAVFAVMPRSVHARYRGLVSKLEGI